MLRRFFLVNILPIAYLGVDVIIWFAATPLGFQRFGSVGVLLAALMFGIDRALRLRYRPNPNAQEQLIGAEILLVVLGTAQWGYGDLFHCWSHGNGWQMC
ncbi:MAG: hypothetical protein AAF376_02415 [Pseudomonadota bacterium]